MEISDTTKYFIHANLTADGVVERSDVVGAIFGQTEGLLGDELDLRDLQRSSKISRMDVEVESENGKSYGTITIGSSLDKVETAVLAASLETIERVGPCTANVEIEMVEDVRATKRKRVVERAKYILTELFDENTLDTQEILNEVRETVRTAEISTYAGLPAGPNVERSDAILIVEGRADVLNLLKYGIKNAIGVEGTNIPEEIGDLSQKKTVTAFVDSDRGGELILKELAQIADVDYVARPPEGRDVEDLTHKEVMKALRDKMPFDIAVSGDGVEETVDEEVETNGEPTEEEISPETTTQSVKEDEVEDEHGKVDEEETKTTDTSSIQDLEDIKENEELSEEVTQQLLATVEEDDPLRAGFTSIKGTNKALLLDSNNNEIEKVDLDTLPDRLKSLNGEVSSVVVDGEITQRVLDIASMKGIERVVGEKLGYIAKKPLDVKVVTESEL